MSGVRHFLLAVQFFTRIPVTGRLAAWVGYDVWMLRASAAHFPGVGWIVGGVAAGIFALTQWGIPGIPGALVAAFLSTIATLLLTGAFHEDGLADLADGLGGSMEPARSIEIMKDSRIGAFGAIAIVVSLGAKCALITAASSRGLEAVAASLVAAHVLSRLTPLAVTRALPHVGDNGTSKSKPIADEISRKAIAIGVLWSLPAAALIFWVHGPLPTIAALCLCGLVALYMVRLLGRRLGGFTGDGLGATQQLCELGIYLVLVWQR